MRVFVLWVVVALHSTFAAGTGRIIGEWGKGNKTECEAMGCANLTSCSSDHGVRLKFGGGEIADPDRACTFIPVSNWSHYNATDILSWVGERGVLAFTGDSIMRSLFMTFLHSAGHEYLAWYQQLERLSGNWTKSAGRTKLDHTFLCSGPVGPKNITVAFLWRAQFGETVSRVPWVSASTQPRAYEKCVWWENGDAMRHCDSSAGEGAQERWSCTDTLDSIQLSGQGRRKFVVVSSGGQHNVVDAVHEAFSKRTAEEQGNKTYYLAASRKRFSDAWSSMEQRKKNWAVVTREGGRHIFILPMRLSYGLPRTVCGHHGTARAMEDMLEVHIRQRMRDTNDSDVLTGAEDGLEVLDTSWLFDIPNAPGSVGDGMHQGHLMNMAVLSLLAHRLINFNASNWRLDPLTWNVAAAAPTTTAAAAAAVNNDTAARK